MSLTRLVINTTDSATSVANHLNPQATSKAQSKQNLGDFFQGMAMGTYPDATEVEINTGAVKASKAGTFTGAPTADQTVTIASVVFTAKASGATGNQFNIGADVTETAANLAAAVNASSNLTGIVVATSALGVVTITAAVPGTIGNALQLAEGLSNFTWASSATALSGGSNGTQVTL